MDPELEKHLADLHHSAALGLIGTASSREPILGLPTFPLEERINLVARIAGHYTAAGKLYASIGDLDMEKAMAECCAEAVDKLGELQKARK